MEEGPCQPFEASNHHQALAHHIYLGLPQPEENLKKKHKT
jgi:hypothetical protein